MRRHLSLILAILLASAAPAVAQSGHDGAPVEIFFLDVGQGDAILIRTLEGRAALVDAGNDGEIVPLLQALDITSLDLLVASHPHKDHIGGIIPMLQTVSVNAYLDNGQRYSSDEWRFLERNNRSVGILLEYGKFRVLLTGDSEREELGHFVKLGIPQVTVLKAAHHGALNGVNPGWMLATKPEVVVISVGAGNSYGHPDPTALRYYRSATATYRTDRDGTVRIQGYRDGTWVAETGAAAFREVEAMANGE